MMEFCNICRLCTSPLSSSSIDLFADDEFLKKIKNYVRLELLSVANLPNKMCSNCCFELENIENFRERCMDAQKSLQSILNKHHFRILPDIEPSLPSQERGSVCNENLQTNQNQFFLRDQTSEFINQNISSINQLQGVSIIAGVNSGTNFQLPQNNQEFVSNQSVHDQNGAIPLENALVNEQRNNFIIGNNLNGLHMQMEEEEEEEEEECDLLEDNKDSLLYPKKEEVKTNWESGDEYGDDDDDGNDLHDNDVDNKEIKYPLPKEISKKVTLDLVKSVKKEKLDVCEEVLMADRNLVSKGKKLLANVELIQCSDELIVGSQMDDLLIKAVKNSESEKLIRDQKNKSHNEFQASKKVESVKTVDKNLDSNRCLPNENYNNVRNIKEQNKTAGFTSHGRGPYTNSFDHSGKLSSLLTAASTSSCNSTVSHSKTAASTSSLNPAASTNGMSNSYTIKRYIDQSNLVYNKYGSVSAPSLQLHHQSGRVVGKIHLVTADYPDKSNRSVLLNKNNSIKDVLTQKQLLSGAVSAQKQPRFVIRSIKKTDPADTIPWLSHKQLSKMPLREIMKFIQTNKLSSPSSKTTASNMCPVCDRIFFSPAGLKTHMQIHTLQKKPVASEAGKKDATIDITDID